MYLKGNKHLPNHKYGALFIILEANKKNSVVMNHIVEISNISNRCLKVQNILTATSIAPPQF